MISIWIEREKKSLNAKICHAGRIFGEAKFEFFFLLKHFVNLAQLLISFWDLVRHMNNTRPSMVAILGRLNGSMFWFVKWTFFLQAAQDFILLLVSISRQVNRVGFFSHKLTKEERIYDLYKSKMKQKSSALCDCFDFITPRFSFCSQKIWKRLNIINSEETSLFFFVIIIYEQQQQKKICKFIHLYAW